MPRGNSSVGLSADLYAAIKKISIHRLVWFLSLHDRESPKTDGLPYLPNIRELYKNKIRQNCRSLTMAIISMHGLLTHSGSDGVDRLERRGFLRSSFLMAFILTRRSSSAK